MKSKVGLGLVALGIGTFLSTGLLVSADVMTKVNTDFYSLDTDSLRVSTYDGYGNLYKISGKYGAIKNRSLEI